MTNYDKIEKQLPFKTDEGAHPDIRVNVLSELPVDRQVVALERLKNIVSTTELSGFDDTTPGCKDTQCSWGMCQRNKELWPDAQDQIWPHDSDRVAPLSGAPCPLDREQSGEDGCFYRCKFFKRKGRITREGVLQTIDNLIKDIG